MRGKEIPLETWYRIENGKTISFKKPKYVLLSKEQAKSEQDRLGKNVGFYYGTRCKKCCGVYPKFLTEGGFRDFGYYVCPVCGKESMHMPMNWECRDAWNNDRYLWKPMDEGYQFTIYDY